jgi:hypothetical protein
MAVGWLSYYFDEYGDEQSNEEEIRELCPNPNARCLRRDNPDANEVARRIKAIKHVEKIK